MDLQEVPIENEMPVMELQIPIGIRTAYGLTTIIFPAGTPIPTTTDEIFFTYQDYKPGNFYLQLVQGLNCQSLFNTYLGKITLHIPDGLPRHSKIHLSFQLEARGLTVCASTHATGFLYIDQDIIFPQTDLVNSHYHLHSMRLDSDRNFLRKIYKKYELAEYVEWVAKKVDMVTHQEQRQVLLDWIEESNRWLELDGTEEEYQEILGKMTAGCNPILYPFLCPSLVQDSGSEDDSEDEGEDSDSDSEEAEEDSESGLVEEYLGSLLWFYWDSQD